VICIFCRQTAKDSTVEHVLPESMGAGDWACLPPGLVCKGCNQYFGSKVEPFALASFPFLPFRVMMGIPTKKGRPPKLRAWQGEMLPGPKPGTFGFNPATQELEQGITTGQITQVTILAEPTAPEAVCRLLLKMGLELVAADNHDDALGPKFDAARQAARAPKRGTSWWFLIQMNYQRLFSKFKTGVTWKEWGNGVRLEVIDVEGVEMFHLQMLDMSLLTPLENRIQPSGDFSEPEQMLRWARF
jgi:hypothetical protein